MEKEYAKVLAEYEFDKVVDGAKYSIYHRYTEAPLGVVVQIPRDNLPSYRWLAQDSEKFENYIGTSVEDLKQCLQKVLGR